MRVIYVVHIISFIAQFDWVRAKVSDGIFEPIEEKMLVNAILGRYIRHAYLLAENAARGKSPCIEERYDVNEKKEKTYFDYPVILDKLKDENIRRMQIDDDDD